MTLNIKVIPKTILYNEVQMPLLGFGTYKIKGRDTIAKTLDAALKENYRSIDTAAVYGNEIDIGNILPSLLEKYNLKRSDIFLTSKLRIMIPHTVDVSEVRNIEKQLSTYLEPVGMESHSFKLDWYNVKVHKAFILPYKEDTMAFIIISKPSMFEKLFIPYLSSVDLNNCQDPLDQCMKNFLIQVKKNVFPETDVEIIHDFELTPSRRPRMLMQTAGHVSGAAKFYQRSDLGPDDPWDKEKKIFGVSIHPKYGGWFAFRGVIILKNKICREFNPQEPINILKDKKDVINLLMLFNDCWKDGRYRDIIPVEDKYSELQRKYFDTLPSQRHELIKKILHEQL